MSQADGSSEGVGNVRASGVLLGIGLLAAGATLFGLCSWVQHHYGSSMFESSYVDPGLLGEILINITFWPGWLGTIALAGTGVFALIQSITGD